MPPPASRSLERLKGGSNGSTSPGGRAADDRKIKDVARDHDDWVGIGFAANGKGLRYRFSRRGARNQIERTRSALTSANWARL